MPLQKNKREVARETVGKLFVAPASTPAKLGCLVELGLRDAGYCPKTLCNAGVPAGKKKLQRRALPARRRRYKARMHLFSEFWDSLAGATKRKCSSFLSFRTVSRASCPLLIVFLLAIVGYVYADTNEDLWNAARTGNIEAVKALLAKGIDVNAKNQYGATALLFAASKGHVEIAKVLIEHGADVNVKDSFYGEAPISWAAQWNHIELVKLLLEKGAQGADGALITGVYRGSHEIVKMILGKLEVNPETLAEALADATEAGDQKMIDILKKAGATPAPWLVANIEPEILKAYTGKYRSERGDAVVSLKEDALRLELPNWFLTLSPVDAVTFKPLEMPTATVKFTRAADKISGFTWVHGDRTFVYLRVEEGEASPITVQTPQPIPSQPAQKKKEKAANWPSFRGTYASGVADGENPPWKWDATKSENIVWRTPIPGLAHSSPIVWEERVFITTAISSDPKSEFRHGLFGDVDPSNDVSKHIWRVYCIDKRTGKILWERTASEGIPRVKRHPKSSQANSTPATDGKRVVVLLASGDLLCYDFDGKLQWRQDLGMLDAGWFYDPDFQWGFGSSPIIYNHMVIVQCDVQKSSYLAAFNIKNGKRIWLTPRDEVPSWGSPGIYETKNYAEIVTNGTHFIRGYDPKTGKELWKLAGNSEITVPTPVVAHDLIFVTSGYSPIQPIYAIRPSGKGDISLQGDAETNQFIAWSKKRGGPYIPTPIVYGDYLYTCANNGVVTCYNAKTGEKIYQQRLGGKGKAYAL